MRHHSELFQHVGSLADDVDLRKRPPVLHGGRSGAVVECGEVGPTSPSGVDHSLQPPDARKLMRKAALVQIENGRRPDLTRVASSRTWRRVAQLRHNGGSWASSPAVVAQRKIRVWGNPVESGVASWEWKNAGTGTVLFLNLVDKS